MRASTVQMGIVLLAVAFGSAACGSDPTEALIPVESEGVASGAADPALSVAPRPDADSGTPEFVVLGRGMNLLAALPPQLRSRLSRSPEDLRWRSEEPGTVRISESGAVVAGAEGATTHLVAAGSGAGAPPLASVRLVIPRAEATIVAGGQGYDNGHTCALASGSGQAWCWGSNRFSELGLGFTAEWVPESAVPGPVAGSRSFANLWGAGLGACGTDTRGMVACWGYQGTEPTPVAGDRSFSVLALNSRGGGQCGLDSAGVAMCWAGYYPHEPSAVEQGSLRFVQIAIGGVHHCGLDAEGQAHCWTFADDPGMTGLDIGFLGTAPGQGWDGVPAPVEQGAVRFAKLALGRTFSCGLATDGSVHCWGYGAGVGNHYSRTGVTRLPGSGVYTDIAAGDWHACLIDRSNAAHCFGANFAGQLGNGTTVDSSAPVRVAGNLRFREIATGGAHSCGRTMGGRIHCWGENRFGAVGDGTFVDRWTPAAIAVALR